MLRILQMTHADLETFFRGTYAKGPFLARSLYREFFHSLNPCPWNNEAIKRSPGLSEKLEADWDAAPGEVVDWVEQEGVVKFATRLKDGHCIETVVISMASHLTVCVSSQVGCGRGCRFCETAQMGFIRNLEVQEITGQVMAARRQYGKSVRNVVFMGMGEPMDNREAVIKSIQVMNDQRGLDIPLKRITLSTVGVINGIKELTRPSMPGVHLAVSLNAAHKDLRDRLMPVGRSNPLPALKEALLAYTHKKGTGIMINYVIIPGVNDSRDCAEELVDWLSSLNARVNLIPLNPLNAGAFQAPEEVDITPFRQHLIQHNVNAQERHPRGRGVMAACGQLGGRATGSL